MVSEFLAGASTIGALGTSEGGVVEAEGDPFRVAPVSVRRLRVGSVSSSRM